MYWRIIGILLLVFTCMGAFHNYLVATTPAPPVTLIKVRVVR